MSEEQRDIREAIHRARPEGFFFRGSEAIYRAALKHAHHPHDRSIVALVPDPDRAALFYVAITDTVAYQVSDLLRSITYVGPLRERARRFYELSGEMPHDVGTRGEHAPEILFRWRHDRRRMRSVHRWLRAFGFADELVLKEQGAAAFSLSWRTGTKHASDTAFVDMGFGLSQVLPLIVQGLHAKRGSTLVAEQPEIHLNPALQSKLADLFAAFVRRGVGVMVETHSEHLLLTLRRLVAEARIEPEKVAIYFVERAERESVIREVPLEANGNIRPRDWPSGFFADALRESLALSDAQQRR